MLIIMATFDIQLRGCVRSPRYMSKTKPRKCPLFTTRKILKILQHVSFDWTVNPARLILKAFLPHLTHNVDIPVILSHRLVFDRLIELLSKNLTPNWQILIKQLRFKPFLYQLSLIWLHKCIYRNSAHTTQFFLTKRGLDSCWLCHRLHFSRPCKTHLIQQHWIQLSTGNIFFRKQTIRHHQILLLFRQTHGRIPLVLLQRTFPQSMLPPLYR